MQTDPVINDFLRSASQLTLDQQAIIRGLLGAANADAIPPALDLPLDVSQGGTGGITASTARTNLGLGTTNNVQFAGITGTTVTFGAGAAILNCANAGTFTLTNAAGTGFGKLCLGPATSSFTALRSGGTTIDVVTGTESGYASMQMLNLTLTGQLIVSNSPLVSNSNVAGTTSAQTAFTVSTTSNGTTAATFGARVLFKVESASNASRDAGSIDVVWTDSADATRTADIVFNTVTSGGALTERMRLTAQGNLTASGTVKTGGYTVATLPTPSTGMRCYVTDATATTFYSTVAGGGANVVPVFYNGTNWVIA